MAVTGLQPVLVLVKLNETSLEVWAAQLSMMITGADVMMRAGVWRTHGTDVIVGVAVAELVKETEAVAEAGAPHNAVNRVVDWNTPLAGARPSTRSERG